MPPNTLPPHLAQQNKDCLTEKWHEQANEYLIEWGGWWSDNQDRSHGLGFPTMSPFERMNHPSSFDHGDLPVMPLTVERVETALLLPSPLPWHLRLLAWRWFVSYERCNLKGCASSVGLTLGENVSPTKFKGWRGQLLAAVQGRL